MRVAYLLGSLNRGGTETLILNTLKNLNSELFDAVVIYRKPGEIEYDLIETGLPLIKVPKNKVYFQYLFELRKAILYNNVEIIHAQQPLDALSAIIVCLGTRIPVMLTLHGYDFFDKGIVPKILLRIVLPLTKKNVYVSQSQKEYYKKKFHLNNKRQTVVYNGIPFSDFGNIKKLTINKNSSLREKLNLDKKTLLLGCVGNFNEVRDHLTICRFLKLLKSTTNDFHFVFIGRKVDYISFLYDECVNYCEENHLMSNVTFLGARNDVNKLISQFDAFIYSTNHDTFGIAVVEAMFVKIPIFVNDWDVMKEITDNGKYATLYRTKDEQDLFANFFLFLQDKTEFQIKAETAQKYVVENFSIEKHIYNLYQEYSLILKRTK
jgi:glycosyltransferase involved in cell wall biosynthesis